MWAIAPGHAPALLVGVLALAGWLLMGRRLYRAAPTPVRLGTALAVLSGGAHLGLVGGAHGAITNVLFFIDGVALLALGPLAFSGLPWRLPAALLLSGTVLAYLVYLLAGWETPDQVGLASKLVEIAALGLLLVPVGARPRLPWVRWPAVLVAVPMLTVGCGLVSWGVALARPDATHQHLGATVQAAARTPTPEEKAYADWLLAQTRSAIAPYSDTRLALAAGYRPQGSIGVVHWINNALVKAGPALDPSRPQGLVYVDSRHGPVLVGAMFQGRRVGDFGPDPGGSLTAWHEHEHVCFSPAGFDLESPYAGCPVGSVSVSVPPMLHVWIVPNPGGPFAIDLDPRVVKAIQRG
ncbi:MAG TPA: hypothetical protein VF160_13450 [Candidatus Dormibacteraeota bacterium]